MLMRGGVRCKSCGGRPAGWLLARSLAEKSGRQRRCWRLCGAASVCVRRRSREHVPPLSQPSAGASCAPPPSGSAASRPRPRRPVASSERLSFRRQTRRFRPPARSAVFFICCLPSWAPFSVWLGQCPTCVRPPGASPECSVRQAAEEATSEARQQRTLLVTPWIPSSFRSITFFLGASSYHEQQRRLSLRQQRRPPSEGAGAALRAFSAPPKRKKFAPAVRRTIAVREKFTLACSAAPRCTS